MNKRTRPFANLRNETTLNAIALCLEDGTPLQDALNLAEISMSNFTDWCAVDPTVLEVLARSDSVYIQDACKTIRRAMRGEGTLSNKDFEAARFVLTKRRRKVFGDGMQGIQAEALMERPVEQLTAEARRDRIKALLGVNPEESIVMEPASAPVRATIPIVLGRRNRDLSENML